ncbi:MAG: class I poly(R)-hydroxyalkanoic acid synthase [Gammaproteobacteria bacterium]|nr:class I poly(R)-hydroxyalkanoic acid synthase [Gammaproteobacteria bacterium]
MTNAQSANPPPNPDLARITQDLLEMARRNQEMFTQALATPEDAMRKLDPLNIGGTMAEAAQRMYFDPTRLMQANLDLWQQHMALWQSVAQKMAGQATKPVASPERGDRRFRDPEWETNPLFDFIKQSYLITSRWLVNTMAAVQGLDPRTARKMDFYTRQFADAFAPSNFIWTNPEVLRATLASRGENLARGYENFRRDMERGQGKLQLTMTDTSAFEFGRNIAMTPGKVVFQNDLIQLIQYAPTTPDVYARPLLIVPPWINKYYILDLTPDKSFIGWAVGRGYTVFVVSWVNPDTHLADKTFADYMTEGILAAVDATIRASGSPDINAIGYCIGGTLLAATLGYMAAQGDERIRSVTFFATQVDFSEPGDLQVFIDERQLANLDKLMEDKGYLEGEAMYSTFNMLRANDLIWSFYVHNYLLGRDPPPFDLLFWNSDATRMPRRTHMFYLREMYLKNNLVKPGAIELAGVPIDLTKVSIPVFLLASREDHIAPYASVFKACHHFSGPVRFVLAGSGHIAGVINPPDAAKYQYWDNRAQDGQVGELADWLGGATEHPGSWWPDWDRWLAPQSGDRVPARVPGTGALPAIEDAPGSYVMKRS